MSGFLDKERIIAGPGFNRWLVPPAALAIHLCIGMAYGFSVFWLPLSKALSTAGTGAQSCPKDMSFFAELFATGCDWRIATLGWMYTLFFVFLGCSAALWGGWLERAGPRKAGVRVGSVLVRRDDPVGIGNPLAPVLADDPRLGRDRRHRARPGLHIAGEHAHQVVPGPPRHGNRHGDHGLRRRRDDRLAARCRPHEEFFQPHRCGRDADFRRHGDRLFHLHDGWCARLPRAADW